ncbi:MAG: glycine-rich domain-containing protein [Eubacteriales bacterium]
MIINQFGGSAAEKVLKTEIFTTSGNWTCPAGVEKIFVRLFGGGAGGSKTGGGGGGYMAYAELNVTPGSTYPITIGTGGSGAAQSQSAGNGGITSFGTLLSANGGEAPTIDHGGNGGAGGAGGYDCTGGTGGQFGGGGETSRWRWWRRRRRCER